MVTLSIAGSAFWRPDSLARQTLELGNAEPVRLASSSADEAIAGVLQSVAPTVAFITMPDLRRSGSGVVVHAAGFVVTNAHVVDDADNIRVAFDDGEEYRAELFGIDASTDLAVLKLETDAPLPVAALGDSDALRVGEFVLALGAPFGLEATATSGIVSGLHRRGLGIARFEDFIVTDAPINRGNSGGPLVNLRGEVVGINTAIIAGDEDTPNVGTFAGVGFAIPVNVMRVIAQRLIGDGGMAVPAAEPADSPGSVSDAAPAPGLVPELAVRTVAATAPGSEMPEVSRARAGDRKGAARIPGTPPQSASRSIGLIRASGAGGRAVGNGTGFVIEAEGRRYMVTNEHVVRGAGAIDVYFAHRRRGVPAEVLVSNYRLDLALLVLPEDLPLTPFEIASGDQPGAGASVVAAVARLPSNEVDATDMPGTITEIPVEVPRVAPDAVKAATDIDTEPGDSGGPLLDGNGEVVAVMVARERDAVEVDLSSRRSYAILLRMDVEVKRLLQEARGPGFDPGFRPIWPHNGEPFVLVTSVQPDGLADELGIRDYDHIVSIDGQPVPTDPAGQQALLIAFVRLEPGTEVEMVLERGEDDEAETITVTWEVPERLPQP